MIKQVIDHKTTMFVEYNLNMIIFAKNIVI
jgi:hypothetical protein